MEIFKLSIIIPKKKFKEIYDILQFAYKLYKYLFMINVKKTFRLYYLTESQSSL
jgi:hypothetical protein